MRHRRVAALLAAPALLLAVLVVPVRAEERATILWKGEAHPFGTIGGREFVVSDAARALGFTVASDAGTGVLTISGQGHQILVGPGTAQVPVDRRIIPISAPARQVAGVLYAPADFFEKVLFPLAGAAGTWDAAQRDWTLIPAGPPPLLIEVAVVHVAPTTQVVLRLSGAAKVETAMSEKGFQVRFLETRIDPPFSDKRYEDPLVAAVRFAGDTATIEFREPDLAARAYPLTSPDRLVVEIGRRAAAPVPGREAPPRSPCRGAAADDRRRPGTRGSGDRRDRPGRPPGEGHHARDRAEARGDTSEGPLLPHGPDARHRRAPIARRPDVDRQPREGGPLPFGPRQLLALGLGAGLRDVLPVARGFGQDLSGGGQPRERVQRRGPLARG